MSLEIVLAWIRTDIADDNLVRTDWDHGPGKRHDRSSKPCWIWGGRILGYYPGSTKPAPTWPEAWDAMVALARSQVKTRRLPTITGVY